MSIDAFTGRNPSYCFVDVHTEDAEKVLSMQGQLVRGRPVKITNKTARVPKTNQRPLSIGGKTTSLPVPTCLSNSSILKRLSGLRYSNDTLSHWTAPTLQNRRLYVGGVPQIPKQYILNAAMTGMFNNYEIQAVSNLLWPHASKRGEPESHLYAFVDRVPKKRLML